MRLMAPPLPAVAPLEDDRDARPAIAHPVEHHRELDLQALQLLLVASAREAYGTPAFLVIRHAARGYFSRAVGVGRADRPAG